MICVKRGVHSLMEKPFFKRAGVCVTAILALGICVAGYYVSNQKQYQQRVAYASAAQPQAKNELNDLAQQVKELYLDDKQELLKDETTVADVSTLKNEVNRIQVTAADFQIEENSMPAEMQKLAQEKETVADSLTDVNDKLRMQKQIDGLFSQEKPNWQKPKDNVVIKEDLEKEEMDNVSENVSLFPEGDWVDLAKSYTTSASDQLQNMEDIQKKLSQYKDEEITYDQYAALAAQIEQIDNQDQQEKFEKAADDLGERFGVATEAAAAESPAETATVDEEMNYEE